MKISTFFSVATLVSVTIAKPIEVSTSIQKRDDVSFLLQIVPNANTCSGAPAPGECVTAQDAVQPLIASFQKYGITTAGEQAALIAWMAYESGDFKYVRNHYPGRPGQGTRCMIMPNFVSEYAATLQLSNSDPAGLLNDVIKAGGEWGAASWYYTTKCSDAIKQAVKAGTEAGNEQFLTSCVQTTMDDKRTAYWKAAAAAFGLSA